MANVSLTEAAFNASAQVTRNYKQELKIERTEIQKMIYIYRTTKCTREGGYRSKCGHSSQDCSCTLV